MVGAFLLFVTMGLHPSGGSLENIVRIYGLIVFVHALAISTIPLLGLGFWGLTSQLQTRNALSLLAFFTTLLGLVAAMLAGLFNGLVLPMFAVRHADDLGPDLATVKLIITYGLVINRSLDYVFIAAITVAMGIWSGLILQTRRFPRWLGYWGLVLVFIIGIAAFTRFDFIDLAGFRVFVFGLAGWIILVGYFLSRIPISVTKNL